MSVSVKRVLETVIGAGLIVIAVVIALGTDRGDYLVLGLAVLGGFFVSKTVVGEFVKSGIDKLKGGK